MDINKKIDDLRFQRGWSMYELAKEAGITQSTLTSMMQRGNPPKIDTLECICEAFGITLSQFFMDESEGEHSLTDNQKNLLHAATKLSKEQYETLINFIETL